MLLIFAAVRFTVNCMFLLVMALLMPSVIFPPLGWSCHERLGILLSCSRAEGPRNGNFIPLRTCLPFSWFTSHCVVLSYSNFLFLVYAVYMCFSLPLLGAFESVSSIDIGSLYGMAIVHSCGLCGVSPIVIHILPRFTQWPIL